MTERPTPETDAVYPPEVIDRVHSREGDAWGWGTHIIEAVRDEPATDHEFRLGQSVIHQGVRRVIYDIDEGYGVLALDGDKYIAPGHKDNRCIEAKLKECEPAPATEAKGCEGETPLTDKAQYMVRLGKHRRWVVRPELARDLERKLGEANKARRVLQDAADHLNARLREEKEKLGEATNVMRSATVLIAAKGRHNTMLAYNGLREALARIDSPDTSITTTNPPSREARKSACHLGRGVG